MSGLVRLHRDPIVSGAHVLALPAWLPPSTQKGATYWHQPRSASLKADGSLTITLWCGQLRHAEAAELAMTSEPPPDLRCGTCAGRRAGYDRADGLIFTPRDHWALPAVCPSTTPAEDWRYCLACGARVSCARGWNAMGLARHAPGPGLADRDPCPRHGWQRMEVHGERLVCAAWQCDHTG